MEEAVKQLDTDVICVLGEPHHYAKRYNTSHKLLFPVETQSPRDCWFARELTPGALDGIGKSTSSMTGPYADPIKWRLRHYPRSPRFLSRISLNLKQGPESKSLFIVRRFICCGVRQKNRSITKSKRKKGRRFFVCPFQFRYVVGRFTGRQPA